MSQTNHTAIVASQYTEGGLQSSAQSAVALTTGSTNYTGGYNCGNCGVWIATGCIHTCYYYSSPYQPYQPVVIQPTIQPTIFPIATPFPVEADIQRLEERLGVIEAQLDILLDLILNTQDEEVCGYPEGELPSIEPSIGVRGQGRAALEAPQPKGATSWPSH